MHTMPFWMEATLYPCFPFSTSSYVSLIFYTRVRSATFPGYKSCGSSPCMLNLVIQWISTGLKVMHLSSLMHTLTSWCLPKWGIFITFRMVDHARSIVHGWGIILDFFPFVLVRYLWGESMSKFLRYTRLNSLIFSVMILSS
jgi:hypothetical protein